MKSIDEMPAGQELNELIGKEVMGWHIEPLPEEYQISGSWIDGSGCHVRNHAPENPLADWGASQLILCAWDVVEEVISRYHVSLRLVGPEYADGWTTAQGWHATFIESNYTFTDVGEGSRADTPALAICRAAYKFVVLNDKGSKAEVLR